MTIFLNLRLLVPTLADLVQIVTETFVSLAGVTQVCLI
jgi:hypothetical protein